MRLGIVAALIVLSTLLPGAIARTSLGNPGEEGDIVLRVTGVPSEASVDVDCESHGSFKNFCRAHVERMESGGSNESGGYVVLEDRVVDRPLRLAPLFRLLARLDPFPVASATGVGLPGAVTLELRIHWGGAQGGSWVQTCMWTDDREPACARTKGATQSLTPDNVLLLVEALRRQVPVEPPSAEFPTDADAARALDAVLAVLPAPPAPPEPPTAPAPPVVDVDPPAATPEPSEPGDLVGVTTLSIPEDESTRPASTTWSSSGGLGAWNASVAAPSMAELRSAPAQETRAGAPAAPAPSTPADTVVRVQAPLPARAPPPMPRGQAVGTDAAEGREDGEEGASSVVAQADHAVAALGPRAVAVLAGALAAALLALGGLYTRLRRERLADQATRERILAALRERPGRTARDLAAALAVHKTTACYHLRVLAKAGLVVAREAKGREHHFLAGTAAPPLLAGPSRAVYDAVAARPGAQVRDVCALTRSHRTTIHYHVRALRDAGLLTVERDGKRLRLYARPVAA